MPCRRRLVAPRTHPAGHAGIKRATYAADTLVLRDTGQTPHVQLTRTVTALRREDTLGRAAPLCSAVADFIVNAIFDDTLLGEIRQQCGSVAGNATLKPLSNGDQMWSRGEQRGFRC